VGTKGKVPHIHKHTNKWRLPFTLRSVLHIALHLHNLTHQKIIWSTQLSFITKIIPVSEIHYTFQLMMVLQEKKITSPEKINKKCMHVCSVLCLMHVPFSVYVCSVLCYVHSVLYYVCSVLCLCTVLCILCTVCKCVLYYCHQVPTQLQLKNK
jgi:putative effector of murein hydrolase LrgA (UPF0299 family)